MARTIGISLPGEQTDLLLPTLRKTDGVIGISLQRGSSIEPSGDVLTVHVTNEGLERVQALLAKHQVGASGTILTSEPRSLLSPSQQRDIDQESNEASWPEMAALLRRDTNITSNYLLAMLFSGMIAAAGLWTDTLHIVIGAMVIAPGFEPIMRVPFGLLTPRSQAWRIGLTSTLAGYVALIAGAAIALLLLRWIDPSSTPLSERDWVQYWSSIKPSSVLIALAASAAGAAIIAAQRSVLTAGVMIALALIPSAAIIGMAMASGDFGLAGKGLARWATDAACVVVAGGLVFAIKRQAQHPLDFGGGVSAKRRASAGKEKGRQVKTHRPKVR